MLLLISIIYISGDFNFDLLHCNDNNTINDVLSIFYNNSLFPLIDRPTRITPTSATIIDNIFSNVFMHKIKSGVVISDITDHFPIYQITNAVSVLDDVNSMLYPTRLFNQNRVHNFYNNLSLIDWNFITDFDSADLAYNVFVDKLRDNS